MVHCLGFPLVTALLPVASLAGDSHFIHIVMVLLAAPATLWVVQREYAADGSRLFVATALLGLGLMLAAVTIHALERFEVVLTLTGGSLLAAAHIWRWFKHERKVDVPSHGS